MASPSRGPGPGHELQQVPALGGGRARPPGAETPAQPRDRVARILDLPRAGRGVPLAPRCGGKCTSKGRAGSQPWAS